MTIDSLIKPDFFRMTIFKERQPFGDQYEGFKDIRIPNLIYIFYNLLKNEPNYESNRISGTQHKSHLVDLGYTGPRLDSSVHSGRTLPNDPLVGILPFEYSIKIRTIDIEHVLDFKKGKLSFNQSAREFFDIYFEQTIEIQHWDFSREKAVYGWDMSLKKHKKRTQYRGLSKMSGHKPISDENYLRLIKKYLALPILLDRNMSIGHLDATPLQIANRTAKYLIKNLIRREGNERR